MLRFEFSELVSVLESERKSLDVDPSFFKDELFEIVSDALSWAYRIGNVNVIEQKMLKSDRPDEASFREGIRLFRQLASKDITVEYKDHKGIDIQPGKILDEIESKLDLLFAQREVPKDLIFRIEMVFDYRFDKLMMALHSANLAEVENLLISKLRNVNEDQLWQVWSRLKSQFSETSDGSKYLILEDVVDTAFLKDPESFDDLVQRYVDFLLRRRPKTVIGMLSRGIGSHPMGLPGIARVLTISSASSLFKISNLEHGLTRVVSRVVAAYCALTGEEPTELAGVLGADPNGIIFNGSIFQTYRSSINSKLEPFKVLELNLKKLGLLVGQLTMTGNEVEEALWQYKLGNEIMAPQENAKIKKLKGGKELYLQKALCRFLIERSINAYGKSIGRSEIDLYSQSKYGEEYVIETKVFQKQPTEKDLNKNLNQLRAYLDKHKSAKGVLAIFNLSNVPIYSKLNWLRGTIRILSINLCNVTPSKIVRSIEIEENEKATGNMITLLTSNQIKTRRGK